jgi:hypothetical protein
MYRVFTLQAYQTSQDAVPRGGIFRGMWRSSFARNSDRKMNVQSAFALNTLYNIIFQHPAALIYLLCTCFDLKCNTTFYFKMTLIITFKIHKMSLKAHFFCFVATCFGLKRPSSGNCCLIEINAVHERHVNISAC